MVNIKKLGNKQLGFYHETIYHQIYDIQNDILEDICDILGKQPEISDEETEDIEKFMTFYAKYESAISLENKRLLLTFIHQKQKIEKEIAIRQRNLLKTIGIQIPSTQTEVIMKETSGEMFGIFDDMIKYIQLTKLGKENKRPKNKTIFVPHKLKDILESLGTDRKNTLLTNEGPLPN